MTAEILMKFDEKYLNEDMAPRLIFNPDLALRVIFGWVNWVMIKVL